MRVLVHMYNKKILEHAQSEHKSMTFNVEGRSKIYLFSVVHLKVFYKIEYFSQAIVIRVISTKAQCKCCA